MDILGRVKGPGEITQTFTFITPDRHLSKIGEFIYYKEEMDGKEYKVIGIINKRIIIKIIPEIFSSNPSISPDCISFILGYKKANPELYEVEVKIMGYFDKDLKSFINPRISPVPGKPVYIVESDYLKEILSARKAGEPGSAHIGYLLTRQKNEVPVILDVKEFVSTHLAILAGTGSGKSYTAGVLLEELLKFYNRAAILVIDPHNEYGTLCEVQDMKSYENERYRPAVQIYKADKIKVRYSSLELSDIKYLLPNLTDKMNSYLNQAYRNMQKTLNLMNTKEWALKDLINELENMTEEEDSTVAALKWRLESRLGKNLFDSNLEISLKEIFKPGKCSILQLDRIDIEDQQIVVATLLRRINKARIDTTQGKTDSESENYINYPVFILIEEAHRFGPANANIITTNILKSILSEGRKFGIGIGLISQRPGKLDPDMLSQCMTQIIMRIVNPIDQNSIAAGVESIGKELLAELPGLSKGQAIIAGVSLNTPLLAQIRKRKTSHGGQSFDAPSIWINYEEDKAVYTGPKPPKQNGHIRI